MSRTRPLAEPRTPAGSATLDAIGLGIFRTDAEGRCEEANPAGLALLGLDGSEALGRDLHELAFREAPDGTSVPRAAGPLAAAARTRRPVRLSGETFWRPDGTPVLADVSVWPLEEEGVLRGAVVALLPLPAASLRERLALQVTVSRMLGATADTETVLPRLLAVLAKGLGCRAAVLWTLRAVERRLHPAASWADPDLPAERFLEETHDLVLERGEGLPGRAWDSEALATGPDGDPRDGAAAAAGLRFALAIPAQAGRRMLGVLELLASEPLELDDDLRDSAWAIAQQIGQWLRRRRAEEALRSREEEFRTLADNLPQLAWMAEADGSINWFNRRWYDYTGTTPDEMVGWGWRDVHDPDQAERVLSGYREAIAAGRVWEDTFPLRGADGRFRWFLSRAVPIADESGRIERWFGTNTDITDQRRVEARAVAAERRLRFALHVARIGSWTIDFDTETLELDEGMRAVFGLPPEVENLPAATFSKMIHPEDAEQVAAAVEAARRERGEFELEFRVIGPDGATRWVVARGSVERRPFGRGLYALGITWDVTDRKHHEEELALAKTAAEDANRAKSQFLANMSHELRTPLSAIIGYAELMDEELEDLGAAASSVRADLSKVEASARHLLSLINSVLDLSKIEAGRMEVEVEPFELAPLVREVCDTVEPLVGQKGNRLVVRLPDDAGTMRSDMVKLRQCLFNLLSNAAKFTEGGEVRLEVARDADHVVFRVVDSGIGMTAEQQARLFQRFAQADISTTRRYGGTGLGLALTRAFAEMLGGTVAVDSREGEGTAFTLTLPSDLDARPAVPQAEPAPEAHPDQVLVIDDDPQMRDLLTRFLARDGLSVVAAPDGEAGLALAREMRPSAVLLDVMMPRMDGWAVLSALRADPELAGIPVIMISMVRETGLAYSLGATDYLTKPVDWARLKAALDRHRRPSAPGLALVVEADPATREELVRLLSDEGWEASAAEDASEARRLLSDWRPDLLLVNLEDPRVEGLALLDELRRDPAARGVPVIALTEGGLSPEERSRFRDGVRRVIQTGEDGVEDLLREIRRIAAERRASVKGEG